VGRERLAEGPDEPCTVEELEGDPEVTTDTLRRLMGSPSDDEAEQFIRFASRYIET